jgi:glutathionylspermidine synthase
MRFDFHWCAEGWRISEVNSDVPGGFCEASSFSALVARHYDDKPVGSIAATWADAIARAANAESVALLSAPGYMEDQQIMWFLRRLLRDRGVAAFLATPAQVRWRGGRAELERDGSRISLHSLVRFYQAEWLASLPQRKEWRHFFCGGTTRVTNPGTAILLESKRFPLVWDALRTKLPTWRRLLPETRDPRDVRFREPDWVLKAAYGNTGDEVQIHELESSEKRRRFEREVWLWPGDFVAQRRFHALPVPSPVGPVYACIGVYTVDGRTAGAYARISPRPLIDYSAQDVPLLVKDA